MERESMEFDVVIVGAGPAGLSTACQLMKLAQEKEQELMVCVVEKGSEVGAHILSGAVFEPGLHSINRKSDTEISDDDGGHSGDQAAGRSIYMALKASGGISPNADITKITITRGRQLIEVDLSGVITGKAVQSFILMAEDHIHVPKSNHFDDSLARPSQITPPGIRVFIQKRKNKMKKEVYKNC